LRALPPEAEVKQLKNYDYTPCPPDIEDPLLQNQFIHELLKPGPHLDNYWITTFPKKLKGRLEYISGQRPVGWGIIINEGINWFVLLFGVLVILLATGFVVVIYAAFTKDVSSATGIGAYLVAILSLVVTVQYFWWQQA
jgi:hypothetical protein